MALSNWDTFALDHEGQPNSGSFTSDMGVTVESYKNWLYVYDEAAWVDGGAFSKPVIMHVNEGNVSYKDVHILAVRGPKNGIYFCVYSSKYEKQEEGQPYKGPIIKGIVGIGCSGYSSRGKWLGVGSREVAFLKNHLLLKTDTYVLRIGKKISKHKFNYYDIPEVFQKLDLSKGKRFNQGDAFFALNLGTPLQASEPGDAPEPIFSQIVDKVFPKEQE